MKLVGMGEPLTIDNYDVTVHERWAKDQEALDPLFVRESGEIPHHLDVATLEKSLLSKWEELFQISQSRHTFAHFVPPPRYALMRNRFFSRAIAPRFDWAEEDDSSDEGEREESQQKKESELYSQAIQKVRNQAALPPAFFERERSHLLNLVEVIRHLNTFIQEIHAAKLRYQKG